MYSPPLLTSLIAWSSAHLSLRDSSYLEVATRNRCVALRDLQDTLASDSGDVETTLAMSLVLCSLESIMADNGNAWYLHLMGAAGVITSKLNELDPVGGSEKIAEHMLAEFADAYTGRWLLRNFAYRDIVMSVAQDRPPLLNSHHFLTLDEPRLPDSHFGLASEILEIISITSRFKQNLENIFSTIIVADESDQCGAYYDPSGTQGLDFMTELDLLETRLIDWKCPASPDISLALLAESYRSSAIIHLYRVMRWACPERQDELSSKITGQVAAIVSSVAQMPTRSLPECALLFPLFLAGGEVTLKYHIQSIRNRMLDMIHSRAFRNVEVALSILEKLWERRSAVPLGESSVQTDWLDIVRQDGLYLSLS
ncbi:transcriptional regulator family: Fungal Specific TF [Penicillium verhagenii]|nr:transcriptional regulator family: Fungal Specific TF [Penicillium verhagenii]